MSHSPAVWPLHAGLIGAPGSRNRAPLAPVCPLPRNCDRQPSSPSPGGPGIPPDIRRFPPLPTLLEQRYPANHRTNVLPKWHSLA
jgi:hypothetical protein